jgi:predicted nucleic acid-binding protein
MALYFFDSSALVKRYVHERGSVWVRETTASPRGHLTHISINGGRNCQCACQTSM